VASFSRADAAPGRHLGALGFFLFWIVAASGIYVYAFFDTSVAGAHASVERLAREQWWLGGVMRSLHRYASDAFAAVALAHLLREGLAGRFRGFRWFSWTSGVALLWLLYASGVVGYWLVWDRVAQFSATATAEWLDVLPLGAAPMVRNFLARDDVTDRLFSLFVFLHIGVPLALLAAMWVHIQRIAHTRTAPPRPLGALVLGLLLALALAWPARSDAPAQFGALPAELPTDWFYLFAHPLMYATSPAALWWILGGATLALMALPLAAPARPPAAQVWLARCTGCGHCARDCPYLAISMAPRSDGRSFLRQAVVRAEQCASCGICAGACPTAVPPPRGAVSAGIDLPGEPLEAIRREIDARLGAGGGLVLACRHASAVPPGAVALECAGQLPPSFLDYALRRGARELRIEPCERDACEYRLGAGWSAARLAGTREPHLNPALAHGRLRFAWRDVAPRRLALHLALLALGMLAVGGLATRPQYRPLAEGDALVRVIVVHHGERLQPCRKRDPEELARLPANMRAPEVCPRGRAPVEVRVALGERVLVAESLPPGGLARDGASQLYRRVAVPAGRHELRARVATWERAERVELAPGRVLTVDFRPAAGGILLR